MVKNLGKTYHFNASGMFRLKPTTDGINLPQILKESMHVSAETNNFRIIIKTYPNRGLDTRAVK